MHEIKFSYEPKRGDKEVAEAYNLALRMAAEMGAEDFTIKISKVKNEIEIKFWKIFLGITEPLVGSGTVPGWLSESDALVIEHLCNLLPPSGVVVEVGSFLGKSGTEWAKNFRKLNKEYEIICMDHFYIPIKEIHRLLNDADYKIPPGENQYELFKHYTKDYPNIKPLQAMFDQKFNFFKKVNLVFEDSDHEIKTLNHALPFWWERLLPGGILAGHDWDLPDVRQVVSTFAICNRVEVQQIHASNIWFIQKNN